MTRWPGESADLLASQGMMSGIPGASSRSAVVASNVRYEDGVVCNAPGYDLITLRASILNGVIAHWSFDEVSGTRFDTTSNHNDLTDVPGDTGVITT